jgi:hypothetical protein
MRLAQQVELLGQMEGVQGHRLVCFPMQIQILAARAAAEGLCLMVTEQGLLFWAQAAAGAVGLRQLHLLTPQVV